MYLISRNFSGLLLVFMFKIQASPAQKEPI